MVWIFYKKYWLYIVVVIAVIIVAVSSINIYREEVLEIDPDVKMEEQNTLSFASAYIDTLNPIVSKSEDTYYISKLIYNSLFDYTADLNVEGELVESYTVDTEKAYVDITLRSGSDLPQRRLSDCQRYKLHCKCDKNHTVRKEFIMKRRLKSTASM